MERIEGTGRGKMAERRHVWVLKLENFDVQDAFCFCLVFQFSGIGCVTPVTFVTQVVVHSLDPDLENISFNVVKTGLQAVIVVKL